MNLEFADHAFHSFMNTDIDWMQHFCAAQTKLPELSQWSNTINDELEMNSLHIINDANKRSRMMVAAPAINTAAMGSWDLAAVTMGSWKLELDLGSNAALRVDNVNATPVTATAVPRRACGLITKNAPAAVDISALNEYPLAFRSDPLPLPPTEAAGGSCRGSGALKPKRKRVRPSRRVQTTVVKTDTSNFKAMVEHFTGIPPTCTPVTTQESTTAPSGFSLPESTNSATSPSFSKPVPHPALCKTSNSSTVANSSSVPITSCPSPLPSSSFPTSQSLPELPSITTVVSFTGSDQISKSPDPEEHINLPDLIDVAFFEELWNEINIEPTGRYL